MFLLKMRKRLSYLPTHNLDLPNSCAVECKKASALLPLAAKVYVFDVALLIWLLLKVKKSSDLQFCILFSSFNHCCCTASLDSSYSCKNPIIYCTLCHAFHYFRKTEFKVSYRFRNVLELEI